jgi:hypothetical protein
MVDNWRLTPPIPPLPSNNDVNLPTDEREANQFTIHKSQIDSSLSLQNLSGHGSNSVKFTCCLRGLTAKIHCCHRIIGKKKSASTAVKTDQSSLPKRNSSLCKKLHLTCASLNDGELETSTTDYYSSAEQQFTFATDTRQADEFHNLQTASQATDLFQILLATEVI